MSLHLNAEDSDDNEAANADDTIRGATFRGAFSLDEACSLCSGKVPHFSVSTHFTVKPAIIQEVESQPWIPYTDDGAPLEINYTQPLNLRSVYTTFCELSEIVHRTLYDLYIHSGFSYNKSSTA
ncbi:hypothetical protein B0O99DRAFT_319062 [Bisporella sp. PMI_857]|nr:hypothetical protein B0O99DRAFT_319062 [Bisporella sp. PMI_857]